MTKEAPEFLAGGLERSLLLFRAAVIKQRATVIHDVEEEPLHRHFPQSGSPVQIADDLSTQHPQVLDVFANGSSRKIRTYKMIFQERPETDYELLARP